MRYIVYGVIPGIGKYDTVVFSTSPLPWWDCELLCFRLGGPRTRYFRRGVSIFAHRGHAIISAEDSFWEIGE